MSHRLSLFFLGLLMSTLSLKASAQSTPTRGTARSVNNFCQKMSYDLLPGATVKDVPNTIVKNTETYFLLGYSDYYTPLSGNPPGFRPTFRVRDRFQNEIAGYSFSALDDMLLAVGGNVYLMDISEIQETGSFFITGFVVPDYPNPSAAPATCTPFIAEINLLSGSVLQVTMLETNTILYNILVDNDHGQVVAVGETFEDPHFNPMTAMAYSHAPAPGQGVIICLERGDLNQLYWSQTGTSSLNQSTNNNHGSFFEQVSLTPYGYCISGNMTIQNTGTLYPYSNRIEVLLLDFNGTPVFQKSIKTSNSMARAVSAYYSIPHDRIFVLFGDTHAHSMGLFALDPNSGNHGPLTYIPLNGEVNPAGIFKKTPDSEHITVGGMVSNYMSSMGYSSTVFSPFFLRLTYDQGLETFYVSNPWSDLFVFLDGMDYGATNFSSYFSAFHNNFGMFDIDKRYVPNVPDEETFLFASKDVNYQKALLYKANYDHCYCNIFTGGPTPISVTIPDSPTLMIRDWPVEFRYENASSEWNELDGELICGDPDYENFSAKTSIPAIDVTADEVVVYDILGRVLYKGAYTTFAANASRYSVTEGQVLVVVNTKTKESKKIVFVK